MAIDTILLALLLLVTYTDFIHKKIYNWLTIPGIIVGLGLNTIYGGWGGLRTSALGLGIGFCLLLPFFIWGGMGGGDIKLLAAIGALKGYVFVLWAGFYSALIGGLIAIIIMVWHGIFWRSLKNVFRLFFSFIIPGLKPAPLRKEDSYPVPYGFAIALGTLWAWVEITLMR